MIGNGKVSIIIPVYNVEKYLCDCLDSVVNQTYKNIEIILIDDGSTDKSSQICKDYAMEYQNINYIFQSNQGLSAARNTGLDACTGEYVYCLDSDDFITCNTIEIMIREMKDNIDIVSASFLSVSEDEKYDDNISVNVKFQVTTSKTFYQQIISNHAWGKLYRKSLFNDVRYPIGQNYEDVATTHKLFYKANEIAYTDKGLYFYRSRIGAITQTPTEKNITDFIKSYESVKAFYQTCQDEDVDYYMMTILYNIYSKTFRSNLIQKKQYFQYIRKEFKNFNNICLWDYLNEPMTMRLILYQLGIASIFMHLVDIKRRIRNFRHMYKKYDRSV